MQVQYLYLFFFIFLEGGCIFTYSIDLSPELQFPSIYMYSLPLVWVVRYWRKKHFIPVEIGPVPMVVKKKSNMLKVYKRTCDGPGVIRKTCLSFQLGWAIKIVHQRQLWYHSLIHIFLQPQSIVTSRGFSAELGNIPRMYLHSGRIQEFKNRGGGRSLRGIILRYEDCFDAPSQIPNAFVVRVENKIHIVNIACWLQ